MIGLNERDADLVGKATASVKPMAKRKDDQDPAKVGFELEGIPLSNTEFSAILCEPLAFDALHITRRDGTLEPALKSIKAIEIAGAMVGAFVRIASPLESKRKLFEGSNCRISKIRLTPANCTGQGEPPTMSCKVDHPAGDATAIKSFVEYLGKTVRVEIRGEQPGQQPDLPLNTFGSKGTVKRERVDTKKRRGGKPPTKTDAEDGDVGTPEQERQKGRTRDQEIAAQLSAGRGKPN